MEVSKPVGAVKLDLKLEKLEKLEEPLLEPLELLELRVVKKELLLVLLALLVKSLVKKEALQRLVELDTTKLLELLRPLACPKDLNLAKLEAMEPLVEL